jgi:heterocyst specific transport system permease protein
VRIVRGIPLAWLQLSAEKLRLMAAISGIAFAVMLMLMQLGFRDALIESATLIHYRLNGEVVLISPLYEHMSAARAFPDERLYEALGIDGVESIAPIYFTQALWKNPETGLDHLIELVGIDPASETLEIPAVADNLDKIRIPDVVLVDLRGRPELGAIAEWFHERDAIVTEVNGRRIAVGGLFELGTGFGAQGRLITSDVNFLRIVRERRPHMIDIGIVKLKPGVDPKQVRSRLQARLTPEVRVLTLEEYVQYEQGYWLKNSPVGFIFNLGTFMGLIVGAVIVYQILYSDVADHIAEYATLKAMGFHDMWLFMVVIKQALILTALGFLPGLIIAQTLYIVTFRATMLPIEMTIGRVVLVLTMTTLMCCGSAAFAVRKLRSADPAEIF